MNGKKYSKLAGFGYFVMILLLLVVALPVAADDSDTEVLPEDAKLGNYITGQSDSEMAPVDVKLGQYIIDDFDYAAAADLKAARWQAMAEFYAVDELTVSSQAVENDALRWSAVDDYYSRHGLRNVQIVVATAE